MLYYFYYDKVQENTYQHNQEKEAGTAASVKSGALQHILYGKGLAVLHAVDAFVLCAMIHIDTLNIRHQ